MAKLNVVMNSEKGNTDSYAKNKKPFSRQNSMNVNQYFNGQMMPI